MYPPVVFPANDADTPPRGIRSAGSAPTRCAPHPLSCVLAVTREPALLAHAVCPRAPAGRFADQGPLICAALSTGSTPLIEENHEEVHRCHCGSGCLGRTRRR